MTSIKAFLDRIVDDGIKAAVADYGEGPKLDGSVAGFLFCRDKTVEDIVAEWIATHEKLRHLIDGPSDEYWYWNCYQLELEWVLNCLSVALNQPLLSHLPTARGFLKAAEVLGIGQSLEGAPS